MGNQVRVTNNIVDTTELRAALLARTNDTVRTRQRLHDASVALENSADSTFERFLITLSNMAGHDRSESAPVICSLLKQVLWNVTDCIEKRFAPATLHHVTCNANSATLQAPTLL